MNFKTFSKKSKGKLLIHFLSLKENNFSNTELNINLSFILADFCLFKKTPEDYESIEYKQNGNARKQTIVPFLESTLTRKSKLKILFNQESVDKITSHQESANAEPVSTLINKVHKSSTIKRKHSGKINSSPNLSRIVLVKDRVTRSPLQITTHEPIQSSTMMQISANLHPSELELKSEDLSANFHDSKEEILVCCLAFRTNERCKMSLDFTDRVRFICDKGDYSLVQDIVTGQCGYVPKVCLTTVTQFLTDIKYLNN